MAYTLAAGSYTAADLKALLDANDDVYVPGAVSWSGTLVVENPNLVLYGGGPTSSSKMNGTAEFRQMTSWGNLGSDTGTLNVRAPGVGRLHDVRKTDTGRLHFTDDASGGFEVIDCYLYGGFVNQPRNVLFERVTIPTGMQGWCGSNNTFIDVDCSANRSNVSNLVAFPGSWNGLSGPRWKSGNNNTFLRCKAMAKEECMGFDALPVGWGLTVLPVTAVSGMEVTVGATPIHNPAAASGRPWANANAVGMHVVVLTGQAAGKYFPIEAFATGRKYTLGESRYCKTTLGLAPGDIVGVGGVWADNTYKDCVISVRNQIHQGGGNDSGYEFPNTGLSLFGNCFGNDVIENEIRRDPAETIPTAALTSPDATMTAGISLVSFCMTDHWGNWTVNVHSHNRLLRNDVSGSNGCIRLATVVNPYWLTRGYDSVNLPDVPNVGRLYGWNNVCDGNVYPVTMRQHNSWPDYPNQGNNVEVNASELFTVLEGGQCGIMNCDTDFDSPTPARTEVYWEKDLVWRNMPDEPLTQQISHYIWRWFTPIDWSTDCHPNGWPWPGDIEFGDMSGTTWFVGLSIEAEYASGSIIVRFWETEGTLERSYNGGAWVTLTEDLSEGVYIDEATEGGSYVYRIGTVESEAITVEPHFDLAELFYPEPMPAEGFSGAISGASGSVTEREVVAGPQEHRPPIRLRGGHMEGSRIRQGHTE